MLFDVEDINNSNGQAIVKMEGEALKELTNYLRGLEWLNQGIVNIMKVFYTTRR